MQFLLRCCVCAVLVLSGVTLVSAQVERASDASDPPAESEKRRRWFRLWDLVREPRDLSARLDRVHRTLSTRLVKTTDAVDRFFGDERLDDDAEVAQIRVRFDGVVAERGETASRVRVRTRLPFPRTKGRFQLAVDSLIEDTQILNRSESDDTEEAESFAGVRTVLFAGRKGLAFLDLGGRIRGSIEPEVAIKAERRGELGAWRWRAFQSGFWNQDDEFGELTRLDLDRAVGDSLLVRARTRGLWSETSQGVEHSSSLGAVYIVGSKTAVSIGGAMSGHTGPGWTIDGWSAEVRVRRQLHRRWVFLEIAPGASFPRERDYNFTPRLTASLEILFGGDVYRLDDDNVSDP